MLVCLEVGPSGVWFACGVLLAATEICASFPAARACPSRAPLVYLVLTFLRGTPPTFLRHQLDDERIRDQKEDGTVGSWEDIQEIKLLSATTGRENGSSIRLVIGKGEKSLAFARREDMLFEYERKNVHGWGHTAPGGLARHEGVAHFLPTDKVRHWGSADGELTSNDFDEVANSVPVRPGYVVADGGWKFR